MTKNELYKKISEDTGISEEKIKYIDDHIFYELQRHMKNPVKLEFMINKFGVFSPKLYRIRKYKKTVERNGGHKSPHMEKRIELYSRIITMGDELEKIKKEDGKKRNPSKEG